jgi:two-component system, LytTR family, response regulator LytT
MESTIYNKMQEQGERANQLSPYHVNQIIDQLEKRRPRGERILVRFKDKILPIGYGEIALFQLEHEIIKLVTFEKKVYFVQKSLEELERALGPAFYRVNRQFLVNRNAILDLTACGKRHITVNLKFMFPVQINVSKHKYGDFLDWLI